MFKVVTMTATEKNGATTVTSNAQIQCIKARVMDEVPKLQPLALKKIKDLTIEPAALIKNGETGVLRSAKTRGEGKAGQQLSILRKKRTNTAANETISSPSEQWFSISHIAEIIQSSGQALEVSKSRQNSFLGKTHFSHNLIGSNPINISQIGRAHV